MILLANRHTKTKLIRAMFYKAKCKVEKKVSLGYKIPEIAFENKFAEKMIIIIMFKQITQRIIVININNNV